MFPAGVREDGRKSLRPVCVITTIWKHVFSEPAATGGKFMLHSIALLATIDFKEQEASTTLDETNRSTR